MAYHTYTSMYTSTHIHVYVVHVHVQLVGDVYTVEPNNESTEVALLCCLKGIKAQERLPYNSNR